MEFSAKQIANILDGTIDGNPDVSVNYVSKIEEGESGTLSFLANPKYTHYIYKTEASIVIVNKDFKPEKEIKSTLIRVDDAYQAFAKLLEVYNKVKSAKKGISKNASIAESATIGEDAYIGDFAVIGENVVIGKNAKIYPHATVGDNSTIGDNSILYSGVVVYTDIIIGHDCTMHSGVIVGCDGFGFAPQDDSNYMKIAQIGNVIIEDYVEVGSNTTIDRATLGSTVIKKGAKIDNLIQIAHNVEIGENTIIAAQTGISGSTKIGKNCLIGGQVGIIGHLTIGDNVKIAAQSGVGKNLRDGQVVQGSPAFDIMKYQKSYVYFRSLPSIKSKMDELEKIIQAKK